MGTETINPKRTPLPGPRTQGERYTLLGVQLLRQQNEVARLFSERLLSLREAAEALGGITVATARAYVHKGLLRSVRVGRYGWIRVPVSAVRELLEKGEVNNA
jgi:hypothetical protein